MRRVAFVLLALGCAKSSTASVDASFGGEKVRFGYGIARIHPDTGTYVVLSTHKLDCTFASQLEGEKRVAFTVPVGPRGSQYVGGKVGLDVAFFWGAAGAQVTVAPSGNTTVNVEPIASDRVRGSLNVKWSPSDPGKPGVYEAAGSFDVSLCDYNKGSVNAPAIASDHPARGTAAGAPFEAKSAIAWVGKDRGTRRVSRLELFPSDNVNCGGAGLREVREITVLVNAIGGASEAATHIGSPEPAYATIRRYHDHKLDTEELARTAIRFDRVDLVEGGTVSGSILATAAPGKGSSELEGSFSARVCNEDPPPLISKVEMTGSIADTTMTLKYARAMVALDGLHVELADVPLNCNGGGEWRQRISFWLDTGPERAFYAGAPTRHWGMFDIRKPKAMNAVPVTLELAPFALAEGSTVKGSFSFDARAPRNVGEKALVPFVGKGTFETTVCRDTNDGIAVLRVHPKTVDATPVQGNVEEGTFKLGSAVVMGDRIDLYEHNVTCANAGDDEGPRVTLNTLALEKPPIVGRAQPARLSLSVKNQTYGGSQQSYVWLDEATPERIKGRVFGTNSDVGSAKKWQLSGGFDAIVCKK
jgi:hypothetical protein